MTQEKRSYDNSLRNERAQMTQEKIIQSLIELLAHENAQEFSVSRLADKAGVSEPTVYRYFPHREALLAGLKDRLDQNFQLPPLPMDLADLPAHVEELFLSFERERKLIASLLNGALSPEDSLTHQKKRLTQLRQAVDAMIPHLDQDEQARIFGVVQFLASDLAWKSLRDVAGLAGSESGLAVAWALRALLKEARRLDAQAEKTKKTQCD
jgi:AcrR family transcriptional regulator